MTQMSDRVTWTTADLVLNEMLKLFRLTFKIACCILCVFLVGCSYSTDFVVANKTDYALEVVYRFYADRQKTENCFSDYRPVPSIKPVAEMRRKGISWQELKSNEYSCDVKNLEVKFSLQPNMAVNLENMSNFDSADVEIQSLSLKGVSGRVAYDGDQVFKGFRKIDETFHLIEYK